MAFLDVHSNENSLSTKEFLNIEKCCEAYKDTDEEIKQIFSEINKLSGPNNNKELVDDSEDVDYILKRAKDIAQETEILLKSSPISKVVNGLNINSNSGLVIPQIKVTEPNENGSKVLPSKVTCSTSKQSGKENLTEVKRKPKARPFSAGVIESKKRESAKVSRFSTNNTPKKTNCKHESILEELKDTNERVRGLEILNVQVTEDNKSLRKQLDQVSEEKYVVNLKLAECEKLISRIGKEFENKNSELNTIREKENKVLAELSKERNERKNLTIQQEKDAVVIQDLRRQVKEMEMILKRKHPDSVSALIVASKASTLEDNKKKLLEERISRLQQELKDKEDHFQGILVTLQQKFGDMKQKYENHIIDVERQLMEDRKVNSELKHKLNKVNLVDCSVQTDFSNLFQHSVGTQTFIKADRTASATSRLSQNSTLLLNKMKEDSYLLATIKGMQAELTVKQRTIAKINRETDELKKNLRNLQKEKEMLLNLNPQKKLSVKNSKSAENLLTRMNMEMEAELSEIRRQKEQLSLERSSLLDSLKRTNEEFILLKKKRIQDLHTLQLAHEKELMQMNMQVYPQQEEIKLLNRTVDILQERVRSYEDKLLKYQVNSKEVDVLAGGDNRVSSNSSKSSVRNSRS